MIMAQEEDKGFFDRLGEILNAPLPGTRLPDRQAETRTDGDNDDSMLERIRDILNTPLPGTPDAENAATGTGQPSSNTGTAAPPQGTAEPTPELDEDDLDESWWKQDWANFRAHQARERQGLELKQQRDLEKFTAYQQQEKQRFDTHLQQELEAFTHQQQWRLNAWKQAVANSPGGQKPPPPPWDMPRGGQMPPPGVEYRVQWRVHRPGFAPPHRDAGAPELTGHGQLSWCAVPALYRPGDIDAGDFRACGFTRGVMRLAAETIFLSPR